MMAGRPGPVHNRPCTSRGSKPAADRCRNDWSPQAFAVYNPKSGLQSLTAGGVLQSATAGGVMSIFWILALIGMVATLLVLIVGLAGFFQGGEFNRKYGNKLMRARVMMQFITIIHILLAVLAG
jgi:hypothetical protein